MSNARWVAISQLGRLAVQLVGVAIFTRLLKPSDFGLLAMATVVTNFAGLLRDMGTSAALIQRKNLTDELVDTVFLGNIGFGIALALAVTAFSPLMAMFFRDPRLIGILISLAIVFPMTSTGAPHLALLERESRFRSIAMLETSSSVLGLVAGIAAAWFGMGVYSVVIQALLTAGCSTVQLWFNSKWRPKWRWSQREFRSLWRFSGNLVGFNLINYFARNADSVLIGRFLGSISLGWYSMAYRILMFPLTNLTYVINRALLPAYSRQQDDLGKVAQNYLRSLSFISFATAPLMAGLWAVRKPFIVVFMGDHWLPVSDILAWFAPLGFIQSLLSTGGTILTAMGRTDLLRKLGIINTIVVVAGFVVGLRYGAIGVAGSFFFSTLFTFIISI